MDADGVKAHLVRLLDRVLNQWAMADNLYRFCPTWMEGQADLSRFHGIDERIGIDNFAQIAAFFASIISEYQE